MFCPLEKIELRTDLCPALHCMYKGVGGVCCYDRLTTDDVSMETIASCRGQKLHVIKPHILSAKANITVGVTLIRYSEFIRSSFPRQDEKSVNEKWDNHAGSTKQKSHVEKVLSTTFRLSPNQIEKFWDEDRFNKWVSRAGLTLSLKDVKQVLLSTSIV